MFHILQVLVSVCCAFPVEVLMSLFTLIKHVWQLLLFPSDSPWLTACPRERVSHPWVVSWSAGSMSSTAVNPWWPLYNSWQHVVKNIVNWFGPSLNDRVCHVWVLLVCSCCWHVVGGCGWCMWVCCGGVSVCRETLYFLWSTDHYISNGISLRLL